MAHYAKESADSRLLLRNSPETLSVTFYSGETATDADGSVTVGITDEVGATVVASGTATTSSGSGVYTYSLAGQADLKALTIIWSGTWGSNAMSFVTASEVVGGFYTTPAEVRAMDSISGEAATFSAADVVEAIAYATAIIDDYTGTSWVQRYQRDVLNGTDASDPDESRVLTLLRFESSLEKTHPTRRDAPHYLPAVITTGVWRGPHLRAGYGVTLPSMPDPKKQEGEWKLQSGVGGIDESVRLSCMR